MNNLIIINSLEVNPFAKNSETNKVGYTVMGAYHETHILECDENTLIPLLLNKLSCLN